MKKLSLIAVAVAVGLIGSMLVAQQDSASFWVSRLNWMSGAALNFIQRTNSNGQLIIYNNTTGDNAMTIDDGTGEVTLRARTSAQMGALAPNAAGSLLLNSSANVLCISTGTGQGAWVVVGSTQAASQAVTGELGTVKRCW